MELKAHFSNIHKVIIDHLEKANFEVVAAVAWFTDRDMFEVLCKKARSGINVSVALIGDDINQGPGALNFPRLEAAGACGFSRAGQPRRADHAPQVLRHRPQNRYYGILQLEPKGPSQ